ncbi:unnamed protein product [marine sediment metagenome]|uniref:Uncharacterized protein n=1 Tax=marine sediment metagenome TaxID=412755 RepID=X1A118_9ZZZZ
MATMQQWQGQLDLLKMEINQAYQTQNLTLQAQLQSQLDAQQHQYDLQLMEMEIEANREAMILSEKASKMGVNIKDWINYGVYSAFFASVAIGILPALQGLPAEILNKLNYKVEGKF